VQPETRICRDARYWRTDMHPNRKTRTELILLVEPRPYKD